MQSLQHVGLDEVEELPVPVMVPRFPDTSTQRCGLTISVDGSTSLSMWSDATPLEGSPKSEVALQLAPEQWLVIGRQEGGDIEYLDPRFQSTRLLPNSKQTVVSTNCSQADNTVSRGHFMLKGSARGIVLVNGVPQRGGGIRPPRNGTMLIEPVVRPLVEAEELLIEHGQSIRIQLPNQTTILLQAA